MDRPVPSKLDRVQVAREGGAADVGAEGPGEVVAAAAAKVRIRIAGRRIGHGKIKTSPGRQTTIGNGATTGRWLEGAAGPLRNT